MALGARRENVIAVLLTRYSLLLAAGALLGAAGSIALARLVQSLLFGVTPQDPVSILFSCVLLGAVAAVASIIPAFRATVIDPVRVLHHE